MSQMRTITYTVKVNTDDGKKAARDMKVTMRTMEQDSTKAKDSMNKLSNSLGKKFGVSVKATVDDTKSLSATLRQSFGDAKKAEVGFNSLGREYKLLSSKVGRTANQQEQLNAIYRLGSSATLSQKKATVELVKSYQLQRDSVSQADQALRSSTVASQKAEKNYNDLSREFKLLSSRVGRTADQQEQLNALYRLGSTATLTQKKRTLQLVKAYQLQRAAGSTVQKSFRGMRGQMQNFGYQMQDVAVQMQMGTNAMTIFSQQGSQLAAGFGPTGAIIGAGIAFVGMMGSLLLPSLFDGGKAVKELSEALKDLAKSTGLTKEQSQLLVLQENESIDAATKKLVTLKKEGIELRKNAKVTKIRLKIGQDSRNNDVNSAKVLKKINKDLLENTVLQQEQAKIVSDGAKNITIYTSALDQGIDEQKKWKDSNKDLTNELADQSRQIGQSNSQLIRYNTNKKIAQLIEQGAEKSVIDTARANALALVTEAERVEGIQDATKALSEKSKAEAEAKRVQNEALAAERKLLSLRASLTDSGKLDQLRSQYEEEKGLLKGHKIELEALERNYESDRLAISGTAWEQYLEGIKTASMDFEKISADMLEGTIENLSSGIGNAIVNADNLGDAFKNTFKSVAAAGISALVQMGIQRLLFSTLDTGLKTKEAGVHVAAEATKVEATLAAKTVEMAAIKAVYVLNVGGRGAAETALGALNAAASTAAIPIVGPALAPAAASAFTAFGTAQTAAAVGFAGAFDKGGVIPQNQIGIVSEYGDELVDGMLVKGKSGGTRVTGREDTAKIMSGGGGNNTFNITSSGNVSPEAIARAVARSLKKPNKVLDTMVYDSVTRGSKNRGKRFA